MLEVRFPIFILVSFLVFLAIVRFVLREREGKELARPIVVIGLIVVVGGMVFAKFGQNTGLPW